MMDYALQKSLKSLIPKGVGEHPHRGFETVTFAYQGEVEHRDSAGGGGVIKPGDVQWMTAGSGIVHDEFHSKEFTKQGGTFEMVQLWVNLPQKHKMTSPRYQAIEKKQIQHVSLSEKTDLRVIAGSYKEAKGPATTFTPMNVYDIESVDDHVTIDLKEGTNTILLIMRGNISIGDKKYPERAIVIFHRDGNLIDFKTSENFKALLLNGEPINEPVVAHGPFVMNTKEEIMQAKHDYRDGKMGRIGSK